MTTTNAKTQQKNVKPVANVKRRPAKRATLKTAEVAVQQAVDAVAVIPPSEPDVLQDSTNQAEVAVMESAKITGLPPEPQTNDTVTVTIPKESRVLRERLGLIGYITETLKLSSPIEILSCKAEGVVFARQIEGVPVDRILLHVSLISATGKRSIVSSRKKVPLSEWQTLAAVLTSMSITWRDKELKRAAK